MDLDQRPSGMLTVKKLRNELENLDQDATLSIIIFSGDNNYCLISKSCAEDVIKSHTSENINKWKKFFKSKHPRHYTMIFYGK